MTNDNIIQFPTNRIVNKRSRELDEQRRKMGEKQAQEIAKQQTKQFVETAVDDISMGLLKQFVDLAMKTNTPSFMRDLALLVDVMRGMIYRDFGLKHPAQTLSDKMVILKDNKSGQPQAKINYEPVLKGMTSKPISKDVKEELNDLNQTGVLFDPDKDLDE